jgi:hypothetical protein
MEEFYERERISHRENKEKNLKPIEDGKPSNEDKI